VYVPPPVHPPYLQLFCLFPLPWPLDDPKGNLGELIAPADG
jgi:hypothetical protein